MFRFPLYKLHYPNNQTFSALTEAERLVTREDAEERYLSYAFLRQSGTQHENLKVDLQNDFTAGDNRYPKNRQNNLHLLDKYSKTVVQRTTQYEGTAFVQGGRGHICRRGRNNRDGRGNKDFDKEYWKYKECFNCNKKGHPSTSCLEAEKGADDASSSSWSSQAKGVTKLTKDFKKMKRLLHKYSSYKSQTLTFLMMIMRKKFRTFVLQTGDSNSHH